MHTVSVIVPTYNCERYVGEGLDSVLTQLPEGSELLVVDDGSEDGTRDILEKYQALPNVRVFFCEHKGASGARNAGLMQATGEYVTFMDCDDCLRDGFFSDIEPLFEKNAELYIFGIERIFLDGRSELWTLEDREYATVSDFADAFVRTGKQLVYSNCNKLYCRRILREGGVRFEEGVGFGEDRLMNYAYLEACDRLGSGPVLTSSSVMLRYLQRDIESMSAVQIPEETALHLHRKKVDCFTKLSRGTTPEEKREFEEKAYERDMINAGLRKGR